MDTRQEMIKQAIRDALWQAHYHGELTEYRMRGNIIDGNDHPVLLSAADAIAARIEIDYTLGQP